MEKPMNEKPLPRDAFIDEIYEYATRDRNIIFITADLGAKALDRFRRDLPGQFFQLPAFTVEKLFPASLAFPLRAVCLCGRGGGRDCGPVGGPTLPVAVTSVDFADRSVAFENKETRHHRIEEGAVVRHQDQRLIPANQ